jgi:hypothetical protein
MALILEEWTIANELLCKQNIKRCQWHLGIFLPKEVSKVTGKDFEIVTYERGKDRYELHFECSFGYWINSAGEKIQCNKKTKVLTKIVLPNPMKLNEN